MTGLIPAAISLIIGVGILKRSKVSRLGTIITGVITILLLLPYLTPTLDARHDLRAVIDGRSYSHHPSCEVEANQLPIGGAVCPMVIYDVDYRRVILTILSPIYIPVLIYLIVLLNGRDVKAAFEIGKSRDKNHSSQD